ncbi:TonB-dependent receptor plug domain-containing protein [Flavobacterium sp. 17A]|uniref:TonB-dependent receptor plug domain-containing protein n=1 Tax=Flavobacterium potami TaxID=2872310 RepID=A0A9X1HA54_9FLAO|nr:TonB-dependent receptor plug domain-containing protein [Flavobacterium potami]MBZ4035026.1 TonB-dependent receptor plug domain-containing protein [Flavobacterium potami]
MLNTNQSKKRNSWKFYVVVPALVAFVLLFQIDVVAKEKQQTTKTVLGEIESVNIYQIKKTSSDKELKDLKESLKSKHNVDLEISRIKRNSDNLLTSIKVYVTYENQKSESIQTSGKETIKDFGIVIVTGKNGSKRTSIKTYDEKTVSQNGATNGKINHSEFKTTTSNNETNVSTNSTTSTKTNSDTNANTITTVTTNADDTKTKTTTTANSAKKSTGLQLLVVIDGIEMPSSFDMNSIKPDDIESMNVLKGTNATDKYGDKGADGVIEIETKK